MITIEQFDKTKEVILRSNKEWLEFKELLKQHNYKWNNSYADLDTFNPYIEGEAKGEIVVIKKYDCLLAWNDYCSKYKNAIYFKETPMKHLHKTHLTPEQRKTKYEDLHPNYDHSQTDHTVFGNSPIDVICKAHGHFVTTSKYHLTHVNSCPTCMTAAKQLQPASWRKYQKKGTTEMIPWSRQLDMTNVSVSEHDKANGSPKPGDFIARGEEPTDMWLVSAKYHKEHYQLAKD